jgi:hypothetical protein
MTDSLLKEVASKFALSENELLKEGIKSFLQNQLHLFEVERKQIFRKFGVNSFEELDQYVTEHPDEESNLLVDFQRADYLTCRVEEAKKLLKRINGHG